MMHKLTLRIPLAVAAAGILSGCTTMYPERQNEEMRRRAEIDGARADLDRLQARVEGLTASQEQLFRKVESLQASTERMQQDQNSRWAEVSRELKTGSAAHEQLKKEIVDGLSHQIGEVMKTQRAPTPSKTQRGYEHVVEPGQTMSAIAAAYKVPVRAIVEANGLSNANQIRVGQKLFIPE
jgi:LysM repeat protein